MSDNNIIKFERAGGYDNNYELQVSLYLYGGCKFNCPYCFIVGYNRGERWIERSAPNGFKQQPSVDNHYKIIDTLVKINKPYFVYLYGGEPTEYKHTHDVIRYMNEKNCKNLTRIELQTNLNTTLEDLMSYCDHDNLVITPTVHIDHIRDDLHTIFTKLDYIHSKQIMPRLDVMLPRVKKELMYEFHNIIKTKPYFKNALYVRNLMEVNNPKGGLNYYPDRKDVYTGRFNTWDEFKDLADETVYKALYKITYDNGDIKIMDANDIYPIDEMQRFKGWMCDAGSMLMLVDYTGDWWACDMEAIKIPPRGNLFDNPEKFLLHTKMKHTCRMDKCDGCFYINREKV